MYTKYFDARNQDWANRKFGTLLNVDCDALHYFCRKMDWDVSNCEQKLTTYFNRYLDQGITDMVYDLDMTVPTKVSNFYKDLIGRTEEEEMPVDYASKPVAKAVNLVYGEVENPFGLWIDLVWKNGMRPWISFRMNDVHYADQPSYHTDFYYLAKKNGWMIGDTTTDHCWYGYALDYSVPEVREYRLNYILEQALVFDTFGIDLDFQRVILCFKTEDEKNCPYMTDFFRKLKAGLKKAEEKWGHKIRVMARINQRLDQAKLYGFDVEQLSREGLVDAWVPSAYWGATDNQIPFRDWKKVCGDLPVFFGIEVNSINWWHWITEELLAGYTLGGLTNGADGMYQYNTFEYEKFWKVTSSLEVAKAWKLRRFAATANDIRIPGGYFGKEPKYLPLLIDAGEEKTFTVPVGGIRADEPYYLCVGVESKAGKTQEEARDALTVEVNGKRCELAARQGISYMEMYFPQFLKPEEQRHYNYRIFTYEIPATDETVKTNMLNLTFRAKEALSVGYVEAINGILD